MRLAAVYFPKNEKLGGFTYNLGGHYFYKINYLNDKLTIDREPNEDFVDNFYDSSNISLITSIVGENGSGKTTLFKAIKDFNNEYFLILEESKLTQYVYNTNRNIYETIFDPNNFILLKINFDKKHSLFIDKYISTYAEEIKKATKRHKINFLYYFPNSIFDLELNKIDDFVIENHQNNLVKIKSSLFNRQVRFLSDNLIVDKIKKIYEEFPYYDAIAIVSAGNFMKDYKYHDIRKFAIENNLNDHDVNDFIKKNKLTIGTTFSRLNEIYDRTRSLSFKIFLSIYYRLLFIFINNSNYNLVKVIGNFDSLIHRHSEFFENQGNGEIQMIKELIISFSSGIEITVEGEKDNSKVIDLVLELVKLIDVVSEKITLKNRGLKDLINFINAYYKLLDYFEFNIKKLNIKQENDVSFLRFETDKNLSTGEISLLNFFSSIYHLKQNRYRTNLKNEDELLIFLLDEPELGFHPQWKKRFVNSLTKILPLFFPDKEIQVIMSTHDPLTLSDFQNSNIIYLNKMQNNSLVVERKSIPLRSFGTNVNELLANSFFLKNDLIGDFAKEKIELIILKLNYFKLLKNKLEIQNNTNIDNFSRDKLLKENEIRIRNLIENQKQKVDSLEFNSELDDNKIFKTINLIGEPVIRYKLLEMYEEVYTIDLNDKAKHDIKRIMAEYGLTKNDL